ncbi:treslin isoform X1 [Mustela putorius furo]|uniref:Treslin isoform X1 n=2 Tax=Mustela putorius furo TaxID=9669 RepID=A0A8U0T0H6_MUSPF|nr:treslin isoform X1 [Mustela putorius furo]
MACCHNVMLLLDTAGGAAGRTPVRRAALRLLTYLSCRFGLARVRWAFKFFDSEGARSRPSRVSDFRELGARSWEDFEEELDARLGDGAHGAHLPGPAPRASHTHSALMETLLDYQWDRPEITSPTKPILRSSGRRLLDVEGEAREAETALGGFGNAVFLLAPCPHSQRELLQFVSGCEAQAQRLPPPPKQVMEKLLPRRVQEVMIARKITLYWLDTTEGPKLWDSPDHLGYWAVCELLHVVGGTILPSETFSQDCTKAGEMLRGGEKKLASDSAPSSWISALPPDATLNCLLYNSAYEASFPRMEGTLFLPVEGKETQETWTVTLEPLAMHQRHFQKPVRIFLKGTASQWSLPASSTLGTESWMLQSPENRSTQRVLFQQLVSRLAAEELHLVASVDLGEGWPPITGVISPLATNATILTVFRTEEAEFQRPFLQTAVAESPQDTASLFSDVMDSVLNQVHNSLEDPVTCAAPVPEWAQQELGRTSPWNAAVVEKWFPSSNLSGASSSLMESFGLLHAASSDKEESSKTESELTCCLSRLYQRKSREESAVSNQEDSKKKRGVPRTPVRRKMSTMCRSLKMLNVARLNVKAQKLCPDSGPEAAGEKSVPRAASGRTADKWENRGRTLRSSKPKDFKTEEELLSYIHENYQKTVATGEKTLHSCAQNMISTIKAFLKSKGTKELEMNCVDQVKNSLLKTSKSLRQNLGEKLDEDKVRECQLQVFLRLELCLQCPSIHESTAEMEQVVKEVTGLLRTVCLTEDSAYLAKFLEEILGLYIDSIPKTLGNLYDSLGFMIPQKLAGVLPLDFFSDDSVTQENISPLLSEPLPSSAHRSVCGGTESDQLEELRTRSAKKRRKNALIRHKSIAEVSQNLRQIEIPKVSKRATKNESSCPLQQPPLPLKDPVQEVTKVRRNLFNQELISPSKRSAKRGLPRSHSVSAVEGLECKLDNGKRTKGYHRLLTRSVAETPVHKQVSRRLLHRQIKGRSSDPGPDIEVVEESPEKGADEVSLRRSPRIKQLSFSRTNSGSFYSGSQPTSRSVQRVHSFQQEKSGQRENSPNQSIHSPKRLLFGALSEMVSPSEKGSARIQRSSRNPPGSEIPTAYQTPKKRNQKSPSSSKATPRRFPHSPRMPLRTPESRQKPPTEVTPAKQVIFKESLKDSSHSWGSPSEPKVTPRKGQSLAKGGTSPLEKKTPRTPKRPRGQSPGFLSSWPPSLTSSPESPSGPEALIRSESLTPVGSALITPPRAAASGALQEAAPEPTHYHPHVPEESPPQAEALMQKWKDEALSVSKTPRSTNLTSPPPLSLEKLLTSPLGEISKSPFREFSIDSPPPEELDWEEPLKAPTGALSLSCPVPSTPPRISQITQSDPVPPRPPSKIGKRQRETPNLDPSTSAVPRIPTAGNPAALTDTRKNQKEVTLSPQPSPERHSYSGTGYRSDWCMSSPLVMSDPDELALLDQAEHHSSDGTPGHVMPAGEGEASRTVVAQEKPSLCNPGSAPSPPSCGPSSPLALSYALRCTTDRRQRQAATQLENPQAPTRPSRASGSPQAYEVELEMQASGLPKLRIKKIDPSSLAEAEPLGQEGTSPGEESTLPALSMSGATKASGKPEATYVSPPCLRPSHSTPGKSGGQTYICQSCTPTRCPSSTPSPFQTDVGVPWTPSPKHSGKTTPDTIKDWPRRKRAVGGGTDLAGVSLLQPERRERGLELSSSRTPLVGDFELEGVCRLPDQSPPRDCAPQAEEASWGQFGLGSRKRLLPAKEETEVPAKRACEELRGDAELSRSREPSPRASGQHLPSAGDDEVFLPGESVSLGLRLAVLGTEASGGSLVWGYHGTVLTLSPPIASTPPPGWALRSCLSASGLQALTHSPLLFQGRTPSSQYHEARDEDIEVLPPTAEESPFSRAFSRRRPISRTYTRKKLIS